MVCSGTVPLTSWVTALPVALAGKLSVVVPGFRTTSVLSLVAPCWPCGSTSTVTVTRVADAVLAATPAFRVTVIVALSPSTIAAAASTFSPLSSNVLSGVSCAAASPPARVNATAIAAAHFGAGRWRLACNATAIAAAHFGAGRWRLACNATAIAAVHFGAGRWRLACNAPVLVDIDVLSWGVAVRATA